MEKYPTQESPTRRERMPERLNEAMAEMSTQINSDLHHRYGQMALVDEKCQLMTTSFARDYGNGPYGKGEVKADNKQTEDKEREWAGSQDLKTWLKNKDRSKSNQLEMVITLLLHKALSENHLGCLSP